MKKLFITGATGSGKTYQAIHMAIEPYVYLAPCRQLVYEVAQDYGEAEDSISTGECHDLQKGNLFAVYESHVDLKQYKTLIIDEAHYLNDNERGGFLIEQLEKALEAGIDIILLTATDNINHNYLRTRGFEFLELEAKKTPPESKEINFEEFIKNAQNGHKSIYFVKYKDDADRYARGLGYEFDLFTAELTADTPASERLRIQNDFRDGKIDLLFCTNVLAQGLNFPCSNILIEYNEYDDEELILQKLGRLGRYNLYDGDEVFYCCCQVPAKKRKKKYPKKNKRGGTVTLNWTKTPEKEKVQFLEQSGNNKYNLKYAIGLIRKHRDNIKDDMKDHYLGFLAEVEVEETKIIDIIRNRQKK